MPQRSARISACGRYRYQLSRRLVENPAERSPVLFVMLNPSTADADQDDPTIRRCLGFARDWGHTDLVVGNLYALRATNPKALRADYRAAIGPDNDRWLRRLLTVATTVVCAWGVHARPDRVARFQALAAGRPLFCLGTTKGGQPRHPLYVGGDTALEAWPAV